MTTATASRTEQTARRGSDPYVLWAVLALGAFGVVAVFSALSYLAGGPDGTTGLLGKHLLRLGAGLGVMVAVSFVDYRKVARFSGPLLIAALGLMVVTQLIGTTTNGAERWLRFGAFGFQPSDLAKVALVLHVAVLLVKKQDYVESFERAFLPMLFWIGVAGILIGMEDLSTAALLVCTCLLLMFIGRVRVRQLAGMGALGAVLALLFLTTSPHRADRLEAFTGMDVLPPYGNLERVEDAQGEGYQARQARMAFALGGLTGVGPGKSQQRAFLPAPYNDFIFAIVAEEYGLIGAMLLLSLFGVLLFRGYLRIARDAPDPLGLLLATGCTTLVVLYGLVHACVTCGLLPVTGLPLPFVSYGGSAMVGNGLLIGLLLSVSRYSRLTP